MKIVQIYKNQIIKFFRTETILVIAITLAILSSFITIPKIEYIDFKVLFLLLNLMIIVAAFKDLKILDFIAVSILNKCTSYTSLCFSLIFITFFSSMLVTNDVALLTFVPLTIIISKKIKVNPLKLVIFQTLAANLGSSLTPMGNPQNLFIYSFYNLTPVDFFRITLPLIIIAIIFLTILIINNKENIEVPSLDNISGFNTKGIIIFTILFIIAILSVFRFIDYRISMGVTLILTLIINKNLLKEVDYSLLITFIGFFIFIGNISSLGVVKSFLSQILNRANNTYFASILLSQGISNVPATMLIANFTNYYKELLLGVNVGGMGTIIASMASVISFKLYVKEFKSYSGKFLKKFTFYNILGLFIFIPIIKLL